MFSLLLFILILSPEEKKVYDQVDDISHPTTADYFHIQEYLSHGQRDKLKRCNDTEQKMREVKIIDQNRLPERGVIPVNSSIEEKENCLILYASLNRHYVDGLKRIIALVKKSDFKGHILYHIGGWPDLEGGSLKLAHIPQAWKPCSFKEAERLGYKRILWLDCSIVPIASLNHIFQKIAGKGYFIIQNYHDVGSYCNATTAAFFGYTLEETKNLISCQSGFIGVDVTTKMGKQIVDRFYEAACDPDAFYSSRLDQSVLSLLLYRLGASEFEKMSTVVPLKSMVKSGTLFIVDRPFVQH
jgi:hypothetical protein